MNDTDWTTPSHAVEDTEAAGARLAAQVVAGQRVDLRGPLGAGKTQFVRGLVRALGGDPRDVASPTYSLVHRYPTAGADVIHVDLYRLVDAAELHALDLDEIQSDAVMLVEWPAHAETTLGPPTWQVTIDHDLVSDARTIRCVRSAAYTEEDSLAKCAKSAKQGI